MTKGSPRLSAEDRAALREQMMGLLAVAAAERGGVAGIDRVAVAKALMEAGLGRSSAFAWIAAAIDEGQVEAELAARVRGARPALPVPASFMPPRAALAPPPAAPQAGPVPVQRLIGEVLEDIRRVRSMAFTPDGQQVRNGRMLLRVSEEMRRLLESVVRLQTAMHDIAGLEMFHRTILDVIREESPQLAERVIRRLDELAMHQLGEVA